jgi:hypothetical protein
MAERDGRSCWRLLLVPLISHMLTPRSKLSVQEQLQAAADRYEADIRAAGARYDAAMARILAGLNATAGALPDPELAAAEHVKSK